MARGKLGTKRGPSGLSTKPPAATSPPKAVGKVGPVPLEPDDPLESPEIQKLAGEIVQHHLAAEKDSVLARAENGGRLLKVKGQLAHGDWGRFIAQKVPFSQKTVERAINLHHFREGHPTRFDELLPLGLTKADILIRQSPTAFDALFAGQPHVVPSSGAKKTLSLMSPSDLLEVIAQPQPVDEAEALVRSTTRSSRRLIRELRALVDRRGELDLDRDELVDLYDDLLEALSRLAQAFDLEPD